MTSVVVVARSAVVRTRLEASLARREDLSVTGAADWPAAGSAVDSVPDVVVLVLEQGDDPLPKRASSGAPATARVLVLGPDPLEQWAPQALRRGAHAVLPLDASPAELGAAIEAVTLGLAVMPAALTLPARPRASRRLNSDAAAQPLTPREVEILGLLASGLGNKAVATRLGISGHTVKTHVDSLFDKLDVSTRAEAVAAGVRRGILML